MLAERHGRAVRAVVAASLLALVGFSLLGLAACGASGRPTARTPPVRVVTGLYPLAQAAEQIGGDAVAVTDIVPPGSDPRTYRLTAAQVVEVRQAGLVILAGGGFQPSLEAAAAAAPHVVDLRATLATDDPFVWLDPPLMARAVAAIANVLQVTNPSTGSQYRAGARAFTAEVDSTGIDYESTLSVCPRRTIVTADTAFAGMARRYGLTDQVVATVAGPHGAGRAAASAAAAAAAVRSAGITTVFSEPFVPDATIRAVAALAHVKVRSLDPLTGAPPAGWPHQADYLRLMEANLGALNSALGCPDTSTGV